MSPILALFAALAAVAVALAALKKSVQAQPPTTPPPPEPPVTPPVTPPVVPPTTPPQTRVRIYNFGRAMPQQVVDRYYDRTYDYFATYDVNAVGTGGLQQALIGYSQSTMRDMISEARLRNVGQKVISAIFYGNEASNANLSTPPIEVANPGLYTNLACELVNSATGTDGQPLGVASGAAPTDALLKAEYRSVNWKTVNKLVWQCQKQIKSPTVNNTVDNVIAYVKEQNPSIEIIWQVNPQLLSTDPGYVTEDEIIAFLQKHRGKYDAISLVWVPTGVIANKYEKILQAVGRSPRS